MAALALGGLLACTMPALAQDSGQGKKGGRMNIEQQMERLTTELKLTDEQKPKVKAVLEERNKKMQELSGVPREERRDKMRPIMEETNKKLEKILTPDQFKKYQELRPGRPGGAKKSESKQ